MSNQRSFLYAAGALALGAALTGPATFAAGDGQMATHVPDTHTGRPGFKEPGPDFCHTAAEPQLTIGVMGTPRARAR